MENKRIDKGRLRALSVNLTVGLLLIACISVCKQPAEKEDCESRLFLTLLDCEPKFPDCRNRPKPGLTGAFHGDVERYDYDDGCGRWRSMLCLGVADADASSEIWLKEQAERAVRRQILLGDCLNAD